MKNNKKTAALMCIVMATAAVAAGCEHAKKLGDLIAYKVIPRPHDEVAHVMTGMAKYFDPAEEE